MNLLRSSSLSIRMATLIPYVLVVFAILFSAAFLRKILLVGEVSTADCLIVIFSLLVLSFVYAVTEWSLNRQSSFEFDSFNTYKQESERSIVELNRRIDLLEQGNNGGGF